MERSERIYKLKHGSDTAIWAANEIERLESEIDRLELKLVNIELEALKALDGLEDAVYSPNESAVSVHHACNHVRQVFSAITR